MVDFLTTDQMKESLERLFEEAKSFVKILTYNIEVDDDFLALVEKANGANIRIDIIFGNYQHRPLYYQKLSNLDNVFFYFCKGLHSKCFINDDSAIITSMNLSQSSIDYNYEIGVLTKLNSSIFQDRLLYCECLNNFEFIMGVSEDINDFTEEELSDYLKEFRDGKRDDWTNYLIPRLQDNPDYEAIKMKISK